MTDEPAVDPLRDRIGRKLDEHLSERQLSKLFDEVLASTKGARGWCPNCKKAVMVEIPDAKGVTAALMDLANQSFGTPPKAAEPVSVPEPEQNYEIADFTMLTDEQLRSLAR